MAKKKLERRKKAIKKALSKPNTQGVFRRLIDFLFNLEVRQRNDDKKRSKKLKVRVPA